MLSKKMETGAARAGTLGGGVAGEARRDLVGARIERKRSREACAMALIVARDSRGRRGGYRRILWGLARDKIERLFFLSHIDRDKDEGRSFSAATSLLLREVCW